MTGRRQDGLTTTEQEELRRLRRENRVLREERGHPKKSRGLVCAGDHPDPVQGFEFVVAHQAVHAVAPTCRVRRPGSPSSTSSRAGTIRGAVILPSTICRRWFKRAHPPSKRSVASGSTIAQGDAISVSPSEAVR